MDQQTSTPPPTTTPPPQPVNNNPIPVPASPSPDGGPYVPAPILTGYPSLPINLPVTMQADTSQKLQGIADYHPAITSGPTFRNNFDNWFNTTVQSKVPQVSLKDALFSADPKIRAAATSAIQPTNTFDKLDVGTSTRSNYDDASKYLSKEFGYTALTDNENMYAQYKNSGISGLAENVGKFLTRTVGSAILKLGQGVSGMLAMPLAAVKDGNFWSNVSDNALVNWFNNAEKTYKDQWFPVYQDAAARNMGFFERMVKDNTFWTSDFSDGLGFMLSAMLPATAWSKIGLASKLGEAYELTNYAKLGLLQKPLQALTKVATGESALTARGADMLISMVNSTASEAFFEAKGVHDGVVQKYSDLSKINSDQLVTLPDGTHRQAKNLSTQDIEDIASHGARNDFAANFPILMFSNAWETNLLYRGLGKAVTPTISKGVTIGEDLLAQVEKPSSRLGKLWNGRLGFYTKKSVEATWWEGLWEENAQLAAQRLNDDSTEYDHSQNGFLSFFQQMYKQTRNAFAGKDPEAATSIGMGALTGILAGNLLTAAGKEYSKEKQIAAKTVAQLNNLRSSFLTGDIYQKAPDGSYVHNAQGQLVLDQDKLNAVALQSNSFADKAKRQEDFKNPDLRSLEQQQSFAQYFQAALQAGKADQVIERLESMGHKDPEAIVSLGFDPLQPKASPSSLATLARSLKDIYADSQELTVTSLPKGMSGETATAINQSRKQEHYDRSAKSLVFGNLAEQKNTELVEQQAKMTNEQNSSLTDQLVTNHNLIRLRIDHNDDLIQDENTDESTRQNLQEINKNLEQQLIDLEKNDSLKSVPKDGLGYRKYEKPELDKRLHHPKFINLLNDIASMRNMQDVHALEATKIADPKKGFQYYFDSLAQEGEKLAAKASKQVPPVPTPVPPPTTTPAAPVAAAQATPTSTTPAQAAAQQTQQPVNSVDTPPTQVEPLSEEPPPFIPKDETPIPEDVPTEETPAENPIPIPSTEELAPLSQSQEQIEQDNSTNLQDIAQQVNEEHREEGKMIVNSFSIASKAVEYDKDTGEVIRDDKGRPVFNPYQRSAIDNGTVIPGTTIHLKYDDAATKSNSRPDGTEKPSHERYNEEGLSESNQENSYIRIYLKDRNGETTTLGYVHNLSGARRLLTQNVDVEQELEKLSQLRSTILSNPDTEYEATVSKTGFGFANKGDNRSYQSISDAVQEDTRPILAIKKGNVFVGEKGTQIGTRFGNKIREGATVLLLPNNVNGTEVMIPVYVNKRSLSSDPAISQIVSAALSNYLTSGDPAALNPARRYAYITNSAALAISLTNNGLFMNPNGELIFRGRNITTMTMDDLMKQLLINVNTSDLNNTGYIKQLRESPAIQTSFFAERSPNGNYYFHQHTIQFTDVKPVGGENIVKEPSAADIVREAPPAIQSQQETEPKEELSEADKLKKDLENEGFITDDLSIHYDLSDTNIGNIAAQQSQLLLPGLNAFVQEDAIGSISQLLLSDEFDRKGLSDTLFGEAEDNKNRVQKVLKAQLDKYTTLAEKYKALIESGDPNGLRIQQAVTNLQKVYDNYDALHEMAWNRLNAVGIVSDENGYYQSIEEGGDDFRQYDDDSEYTTNHYDSLSKLVKQFISFNTRKVEKGGKVGNQMNSLGLPSIVKPQEMYTKIINWVSEHYFEPTYEGFLDMAGFLQECPDPTVQDIATRLLKSPNAQLKFQFFAAMLKFKTDHIQQLVTVAREGVFAKNIEANRAQMAKVVFDQLSQDFLSNSEVLLTTSDMYGNPIYRVDQAKMTPLLTDFIKISRSKNSYKFRLDQDGRITGSRYLADTQAHQLYDILRQVGIGISFKGFTTAISSKTATNPTGDAYVGIESLFTGGNKILRNMTELQGSVADKDLRNPFISNPTEMMQLSRAESQYRNVTQTDSFRSNGKSYYPFTRMSFVKSIFLQLSDTALTGQLSPLLTTFTQDPFKSASRFIAQAKIDPNFSAELWFARGAKETGTKSTNEEVKDMNDKDFILSKIFAFQNSGNQYVLFYSDTYSDKTTRFQIKAKKQPVTISFSDRGPKIDDATINSFYHYFLGELRRVNWVRGHNESLPNEQRIAGFHDIVDAKGVTREGIGKHFVIFNFLNEEFMEPDIASLIYNSDGSVKTDPTAIATIKSQIHQKLVDNINNYTHYLNDLGLFTNANGEFRAEGISDTNYLRKMVTKLNGLGESQKSFYITADYLLNSSLNSLEMLTLTGDPAQSPKVNRTPSGKINIAKSIRDTLVEASKRNASLNAPFDQGINARSSYKVGFVQDVKINSAQLAEYKRLLPSQAKEIENGYKNGDMTDAQELTTVKEHLYNLLSLGRISPTEMIEGLSRFDREDFMNSRQELAALLQSLGIQYTLNPEKLSEITSKKDMTGFLQVFKGVQRYSRWDDNLGMSVETYIKTSSFPLVPHLVEGKDFGEVLRQMKTSKIDRLNFSSGTKQGLINPQSIYLADGNINPNLFTNNVIELPANAWGEQGQNPEKDELQVTEGSQQQRLIFVDLPDDTQLTYKGQPITGKELRAKYMADHKTVFQSKVDGLFKEMKIETIDETNYFTTYKTLSDILQREGIDRDFDRNTLLSVGLNPQGMFEVPLTFLPNSSQIQSLIAAIVSNRILKNKLPGTSLIQGSEIVIKTQGKLKVTEDITSNKDNIVWTKSEHRNLNKLAYIRTEGGEVKPAQIILPFYWKTAEGKSIPLSSFTTQEGFLDTSKIDPELLEINGFRIPYAGPNSGMWFEVVGYLPETMGSLVIVPAEVAAQMGADYDVDKLFTYVLNHNATSSGIRVDTSTPRKVAENDIIQAHKAVYLDKSRLSRVIEPTSTDELAEAVSRNLPKASSELTQIFDPAHQDKVWLSNRAGQLGVGISANTNTFHAIAQQSNLFTTGYGVKFLDKDGKDGKVYNEVDHPGDTINSPDNSIYNYQQGMDTISPLTPSAVTRLDRIHTFPNPYTGETRPISSVINNWLQASVDNAKLQLLGAAGINKFNFNAALTIVLHGFDSDWVVPFINQPILKEYYSTIQNVNDKFNRDYSTNRRGAAIDGLIGKYVEAAGIKDFDGVEYKPVSHKQLLESINSDMKSLSKEQIATQLEILKQFLQMDKEGMAISRISSDAKVEVRGLSKSFSEINQQAKDISAMGQGLIGNSHRIMSNTVSGIYLNVPAMVDRLFTNPDNPAFAYSTPTYQQIGSTIQELAGRSLNNEQLDDVYKEFKQFVYTHPSLGLSHESSLEEVKKSLLFGGNSVVSLWRSLKDKYPNSILLNQLSPTFSQRANDPQVLTMQKSADDIATQVKQEWLDFFKSTDPVLVTFINRLTTYSLALSSKEFGPSNLLNYIPFEVLKGISFGENLNKINQSLSKPELFNNFYRQYFQHNPSMAKFILSSNLPKNTLYQQFEGKATNIPATFTLPEPTLQNLKTNPAYAALASRQDKDTFSYFRFVRTFVNDQVGFTLYELQKDGRTYNRIDTLGNQYISEYNLSSPNIRSAFPIQQSSQQSDNVSIPQANNDITATYQEAGSQLDDVLSTIQLRNTQSTEGVDRLFYELAKALSGKSGYQIEFTQGTGIRGTTFHANERIEVHPTDIQKVATKLNIPFEQALQQTILHEAVHATTDRFVYEQEQLPTDKQDRRYKDLQSAWNTYRKNLVESNKSTLVRGIPDSFLEAELFKVLYQRFADKRQGRSDHAADIQTVFRNWDEIKKSRQEILSIINDLQKSMAEAHNVHSIGQKANFELITVNNKGEFVPIDTERVAQITDYLDKNFVQTSSSDLKDKYYAYVNVNEFMTMALTSPGFMSHLNSIPSSKDSSKTIWSKLLDIIKNIVSSFNPSSLLSEAVDAVMNIANYRQTQEAISPTIVEQNPSQETSPEAQLPQTEEKETPPWEDAPAPELPTATPQIPTSDNLTSFTFSDGTTIDTEGKVLNPQQREGLQKIADLVEEIMTKKPVTKLFTLSGYAGCLGHGTKVLMFDGTFKEVQDVRVGDQLMGTDSTPRNVLELKRGTEQMYWIHQKKGMSYRVNESHILSLKNITTQKYKKITVDGKRVYTEEVASPRKVEIVNISVRDYISRINQSGQTAFKKHSKGYQAGIIEFPSKNVLIDPYYLGLWLGDGHTCSINVITNPDTEIHEYLLSKFEIKWSKNTSDCPTLRIQSPNQTEHFKLLFDLKTSTSLTEKYIPDSYLYNSISVRLRLLAGIIDTDGYYNKISKEYEIISKHKRFAHQITYLCRSLGFRTNIRSKIATCKECKEDGYLVWRITFSPECIIPTLVKRKKYDLDKSNFKDRLNTGIWIEKDIIDSYYGFVLDGDHLFMLEDFTVTHNTGKSSTIKFLVKYLNKKWRGQILFALSTPTHKANKVLRAFFRGTINDDPITTKSILGYKAERDPQTNRVEFVLDEKKNKMPRNGVVIIDESSFIGQKEYSDLLAAASQKNATIIFMGDIAQIPPPDGSNKVSPTFSVKNQFQLTQVMRQADGNPLSPLYDIVRNNLLVDGFQNLFPHKTSINSKGEGIEFIRGTYKETAKLLAPAVEAFKSDAFKTDKLYAKIIAYGNPTVESYNQRVRQAILPDSTEDFQVGELLMGYEQKGEEPVIQNGQDYIITDRQYVSGKSIPGANYKVNGYQLKVREADQPEGSRTQDVFILNPKDLENQQFLQHYINLLEQAKKVKGYEYFDILRNITKIEQAAIVPETVYSYQGKYYTNFMLRQQFPALFQYDEQTSQRPVDKMLSVAKNVDYGYAVTTHKVQGSTYKNVFIDENNLEFDKRLIAGPDGKPMSYERNNLLYVALSRPITKAVVLSRHTIDEANTHQASSQELAENRPVSQAMKPVETTSEKTNAPVLNTSDSTVDKIRKGTKTYLNAQNQLAEGTYYLKDGTRVQLIYQGEVVATKDSVFIAQDPNDESTYIQMPKDQYAKREGFNSWAEFVANAKNSQAFINGEEPRYSYQIKTMGKNYDLTEESGRQSIIDALKEKGLLKQEC